MSNELAVQRDLIQQNSSWAQRLINLLSGCVVDRAQTSKISMLSLPQPFVAAGCHTRGSSWQDMDHGTKNSGFADAAREEHSSP